MYSLRDMVWGYIEEVMDNALDAGRDGQYWRCTKYMTLFSFMIYGPSFFVVGSLLALASRVSGVPELMETAAMLYILGFYIMPLLMGPFYALLYGPRRY